MLKLLTNMLLLVSKILKRRFLFTIGITIVSIFVFFCILLLMRISGSLSFIAFSVSFSCFCIRGDLFPVGERNSENLPTWPDQTIKFNKDIERILVKFPTTSLLL